MTACIRAGAALAASPRAGKLVGAAPSNLSAASFAALPSCKFVAGGCCPAVFTSLALGCASSATRGSASFGAPAGSPADLPAAGGAAGWLAVAAGWSRRFSVIGKGCGAGLGRSAALLGLIEIAQRTASSGAGVRAGRNKAKRFPWLRRGALTESALIGGAGAALPATAPPFRPPAKSPALRSPLVAAVSLSSSALSAAPSRFGAWLGLPLDDPSRAAKCSILSCTAGSSDFADLSCCAAWACFNCSVTTRGSSTSWTAHAPSDPAALRPRPNFAKVSGPACQLGIVVRRTVRPGAVGSFFGCFGRFLLRR